ncbi:Shiga toxin A subunit [Pseudescherichia sp.]|uniref:Shiga toxin A subunit n=1 Tax=Pseudescherichia sp. TaxID=2055881 RepID=UPI00289DC645|nr:Shiga toxin A subunit [Pseudescherichia sp.]
MSIRYFCLLISIPCIAHAQHYGCATVGALMEQSLFDSVTKDLNIRPDSIQRKKTRVDIIDVSPISSVFANQLAHIDYESDKSGTGKAILSEEEYFSTLYDNGVKSITAKYIYLNKQNKRDVFIATSLMNNDECSIRFNGYITLAREF